jgi:predicted ester cyclase
VRNEEGVMDNERSSTESVSQPTRDEIAALFAVREKHYAMLDAAALARDYAPDAVVQSPFGGNQLGAQAAERTLATFFKSLAVRSMIFDPPVIDGQRVAQVAQVEGVHDGAEFLGLPATGKHFRFTIAFAYELRDRQIIHEQRIYDFTGLLVQLGVLKAKPW